MASVSCGLLVGLVPIGIGLIQAQGERDALQRRLQVANLEMNLANAALMARHGDYTAARDAASRFFDDARQAVDGRDTTLTAGQLTTLKASLAERDALITLLRAATPPAAKGPRPCSRAPRSLSAVITLHVIAVDAR